MLNAVITRLSHAKSEAKPPLNADRIADRSGPGMGLTGISLFCNRGILGSTIGRGALGRMPFQGGLVSVPEVFFIYFMVDKIPWQPFIKATLAVDEEIRIGFAFLYGLCPVAIFFKSIKDQISDRSIATAEKRLNVSPLGRIMTDPDVSFRFEPVFNHFQF